MEIITTDEEKKISDERTWKNRAIIPRYVIEPLEYLSIENLYKIAF